MSALKHKKRSYSCDGDLEYPKVLSDSKEETDILIFASDMDKHNGNMVIGGKLVGS